MDNFKNEEKVNISKFHFLAFQTKSHKNKLLSPRSHLMNF